MGTLHLLYKQTTTVTLPDGKHISSSHKSETCLPHLPTNVRQAYILPQLKNKARLSLEIICDNAYTVKLTQENIDIICNYNSKLNLHGKRDHPTRLWIIDINGIQDHAHLPSGSPS